MKYFRVADDGEEFLKSMHNELSVLSGNGKEACESCEVILTGHYPLHLCSENVRLRVAAHVNEIDLKSILKVVELIGFFAPGKFLRLILHLTQTEQALMKVVTIA